jgi:hypothetical protein
MNVVNPAWQQGSDLLIRRLLDDDAFAARAALRRNRGKRRQQMRQALHATMPDDEAYLNVASTFERSISKRNGPFF